MGYETGFKADVISELIRCAIQDRSALIDAHTTWNPITGEREFVASDSEETVNECEAAIRDFERLEGVLK